jgi:hypothetical protein
MKKPTIPELVEMKRELVEKHLSNYVETDTGCWEFQGGRSSDGYGNISIAKAYNTTRCDNYGAHRLSYYYHTLVDPASLLVRHDCDNPCCINPAHLRLGTHTDNARDCVERGRSVKGEKNGRSKLTNEDVLNIKKRLREGKESKAVIAKDFGVGREIIRLIYNRCNWSHIQLPSETRTKELQNPHQLTLTL